MLRVKRALNSPLLVLRALSLRVTTAVCVVVLPGSMVFLTPVLTLWLAKLKGFLKLERTQVVRSVP